MYFYKCLLTSDNSDIITLNLILYYSNNFHLCDGLLMGFYLCKCFLNSIHIYNTDYYIFRLYIFLNYLITDIFPLAHQYIQISIVLYTHDIDILVDIYYCSISNFSFFNSFPQFKQKFFDFIFFIFFIHSITNTLM